MILIVGLGNPGKKYINNRHNIGFKVVNELAKRLKVNLRYSITVNAGIAKKSIDTKEILLVLPQAYMNNSGAVVRNIIKRKRISPKDLLVVYDDVDLSFGSIRIRPKGSAAGHKGMKSIIGVLNTQDFPRMRIGVGRPSINMETADYVLADFNSEEKTLLPDIINKAAEGCLCWMQKGIDSAMVQFN